MTFITEQLKKLRPKKETLEPLYLPLQIPETRDEKETVIEDIFQPDGNTWEI